MANNCKIPCKLWIFAMSNAIISWTCGNYCSNQIKKIGGLQAIWYLPWGAIVNAISQYACTEPLKSFSISPGRLWGWCLRGRSWVTQKCWITQFWGDEYIIPRQSHRRLFMFPTHFYPILMAVPNIWELSHYSKIWSWGPHGAMPEP